MTPVLLFTVLQAAVILLLTADRWVHRVTGKQPLESRVEDAEADIGKIKNVLDNMNDKASRDHSRYNVKIGNLEVAIAVLKSELIHAEREIQALRRHQ